jgi:serine/threonine protein phosphatase PrpC
VRAVLLRGRDYTVLGQLTAVGLSGAGALAITRGAQPKPYAHVDPNEDGALVLDANGGVLIAVVDGHLGRAASEFALDAVREAGSELLRDDDSLFRHSVEAMVARVVDELRAGHNSRTCFVLATLIGAHCRWASFGDSALLRAHSELPVSRVNSLVLRPELSGLPEPGPYWIGSFSPERGERIAAVTDGVTNFVQELQRMPAILNGAPSDLEAARDIVSAAMEAGAGDNVAVACCHRSA